jgi:hypothetical protein
MMIILSFSDTASLISVMSITLQWRLLACHCESVLTELFSEFPVVLDAAARGFEIFPICLRCLFKISVKSHITTGGLPPISSFWRQAC